MSEFNNNTNFNANITATTNSNEIGAKNAGKKSKRKLPDAPHLKVTAMDLARFVDEAYLEDEDVTNFKINKRLAEKLDKVLRKYPKRITKIDLLNYLVGNCDKVFGNVDGLMDLR